ncbi:hypothetical protein ACP6JD_006630 [Aspergillus fumigatus]
MRYQNHIRSALLEFTYSQPSTDSGNGTTGQQGTFVWCGRVDNVGYGESSCAGNEYLFQPEPLSQLSSNQKERCKSDVVYNQNPIDIFTRESKSLLDIRKGKEYRGKLKEIQEVDHCGCQQNTVQMHRRANMLARLIWGKP